jgi:hypothetical protein
MRVLVTVPVRTAASAMQSRPNPVSGRCLPKTGIFQISAGDYRRFRSRSGQFRSPETDSQFAKARHWRAFLAFLRVKSPVARLVGWGGRIRTSIWRVRNQTFSHVRQKRQNLFPMKFISNSKGSIIENRTEWVESRASERNGHLENNICPPCRSGVRSPDEKSLLLPDLIAREFARRTHSLGQAGGGRETRIELSPQPRTSASWEGEELESNSLLGQVPVGRERNQKEICSLALSQVLSQGRENPAPG